MSDESKILDKVDTDRYPLNDWGDADPCLLKDGRMSDELKILNKVAETGYKDTTVGELLRELATLPPQMPIMIREENIGINKYFTGLKIGGTEKPILFLHGSNSPESKRIIFEPTQEEQEADKRHKALQMGKEKQDSEKL